MEPGSLKQCRQEVKWGGPVGSISWVALTTFCYLKEVTYPLWATVTLSEMWGK